MVWKSYALVVMLGMSVSACMAPQLAARGVLRTEFLFDSAPFPSVHASTLVETADSIVAAWFGGTREGAEDVSIWMSRQVGVEWTAPVEVATGVQPDGSRYPCWNPVLFAATDGVLTLFYKVGPSPRLWWGEARTSQDGGITWGEAQRLPEGVLGPIKNKPVQLADGSIISPSSTETDERPSTWRIHFERSIDGGRSWSVVRPRAAPIGTEVQAIQPSILIHAEGRLQAVGRSRSGRVFETWSEDEGQSWSPVTLMALPNPSSGTDAVTLSDGRHLIVYNHTARGRSPLNVAVSQDGLLWEAALVLERDLGEYSYPAVIQTSDGLVHISYTWRRERIRHVVIDPTQLVTVPMSEAEWPDGVQ
ncbi:MAG TPA: sialidase [Gammaproteobacteria bacterium]|jgi:predicted neuraminidase|nr:sialidase [Gammaproteobacteria bacterium]